MKHVRDDPTPFWFWCLGGLTVSSGLAASGFLALVFAAFDMFRRARDLPETAFVTLAPSVLALFCFWLSLRQWRRGNRLVAVVVPIVATIAILLSTAMLLGWSA